MSTKNLKIESILPLSYLQRALLFHSLAEVKDQGIIQVSCRLEGQLNREAFERAWQYVLKRHPALRSSVHWKKMKEPVQVIRPQASLPLPLNDLTDLPPHDQQKIISDFKTEDSDRKFELTKAPLNRLMLFQTAPNLHEFLWTSHHLLLDGWSAGVVLRDVFTHYEAEVKEKVIQLPTLPSLQHYVSWLKKQDRTAASTWWKKHLDGFSSPTLLGSGAAAGAELRIEERCISTEDFSNIFSSIREYRLTLNTVAQGLWGLLLSQLFSSEDVLWGTTVSGRTPDIPRHQEMAGLFTNAIPIRVSPQGDRAVLEWLQELQANNLEGIKHDFASIEEITEWSGLAPNTLRFDHLLLLQNYPWTDLSGGGISVSNFSGDLTSTHPLVVMLQPQNGLTFTFRYDPLQVSEATIQWLLTEYVKAFQNLSELLQKTIPEIRLGLKAAPPQPFRVEASQERAADGFAVANSPTELTLTRLWEELLSLSPIGVTDDFFHSGGTSMLAIRLFARIETAFDKTLPPITILQHRTVRELANLIDAETTIAWTTIVPLKASGSKPAIFCFHAGMGHVFYYHSFSKLVDKDRPVYAIQPSGLDEKDAVHTSIQEMAKHYLREIRQVQPDGPYLFLSYCFSAAVCVELCHLLRAEGQPPPVMLVVDSAPLLEELDKIILFRRKKRRLKWFAGRLIKGQFRQLKTTLQLDYLPTSLLPRELREERKVNQIKDKYVPLYEKYIWKNIDSEVLLIRSSEFAAMPVRQRHLDTWNRLSGNRLKTVTVIADHNDFFKEPAVNRLAEAIEAHLQEKI